MAESIRSRRINELKKRASRTDIHWINRRLALQCLLGVRQLGEKTQAWCQRLIYAMRDQYAGDLVIQTEIDTLQERLDKQRELLKRRLARKAEAAQEKQPKIEPPAPAPVVRPW